jgi:hypothetical protein
MSDTHESRAGMTLAEAREIALALPERSRMALAAWTLDALRQCWQEKGTYRALIYDYLGFDEPADRETGSPLPDPYRLFLDAGAMDINNALPEPSTKTDPMPPRRGP